MLATGTKCLLYSVFKVDYEWSLFCFRPSLATRKSEGKETWRRKILGVRFSKGPETLRSLHREHTMLLSRKRANKGVKRMNIVYLCLLLLFSTLPGKPLLTSPV